MFNWIVSLYIGMLETIFLWLMLSWIVRNRKVWSFIYMYLQNVFINHIFYVYVKTGFGIK